MCWRYSRHDGGCPLKMDGQIVFHLVTSLASLAGLILDPKLMVVVVIKLFVSFLIVVSLVLTVKGTSYLCQLSFGDGQDLKKRWDGHHFQRNKEKTREPSQLTRWKSRARVLLIGLPTMTTSSTSIKGGRRAEKQLVSHFISMGSIPTSSFISNLLN